MIRDCKLPLHIAISINAQPGRDGAAATAADRL
jgi:hypothetical protein